VSLCTCIDIYQNDFNLQMIYTVVIQCMLGIVWWNRFSFAFLLIYTIVCLKLWIYSCKHRSKTYLSILLSLWSCTATATACW